jgi:hypothetical protein
LPDRPLLSRTPKPIVHPFDTRSRSGSGPAVESEGSIITSTKVNAVEEETTVVERVGKFSSRGHTEIRHGSVEGRCTRIAWLLGLFGRGREVLVTEAEIGVSVTVDSLVSMRASRVMTGGTHSMTRSAPGIKPSQLLRGSNPS